MEVVSPTWKWRMIVQMRPRVSFGFPSTISSARMFTSRICNPEDKEMQYDVPCMSNAMGRCLLVKCLGNCHDANVKNTKCQENLRKCQQLSNEMFQTQYTCQNNAKYGRCQNLSSKCKK